MYRSQVGSSKQRSLFFGCFPGHIKEKFHYYYGLTYSNDDNGTITGKKRTYGTEAVELTITPQANKALDNVTWTSSGKTIELNANADGKFIMPDSNADAVITVSFGVPCGAQQSWSFDGQDTLTISGIGAMNDWNSTDEVPWNNYRSSIKNVVMSEGITTISSYAFMSCTKLTGIKIPDTVSSIGADAFKGCSNLKSVVLNKSAYSKTAFPDFAAGIFHYYYDVEYYADGYGTISGKNRSYGTDVLEISVTHLENYSFDKLRMTYGSVDKYVNVDFKDSYQITIIVING